MRNEVASCLDGFCDSKDGSGGCAVGVDVMCQ
jgi:hypothetical protein